jgi:hypothetical protein
MPSPRGALVLLAVAWLVQAAACNGKEPEPTPLLGSPPPSVPESSSAPWAPAEIGGETDPLGIPECDSYRDRLVRCLNRLSGDAAVPARAELASVWAAWRRAATYAEGKKALPTACKAALDGSRAAYAASACDF